MNDNLSEFWRATWSAWRSGVLSPETTQKAAGEYDDFVKTCEFVNSRCVLAFFITHPPLPKEFYICAARNGEWPWMVMTSQRLWVYDKQKGEYSEFNLADIAQYKGTVGWNSSNCTIRLKDNTEQTYQKIKALITASLVALAVERCSSQQGWTISSPTTQPLGQKVSQSQKVGSKESDGWTFKLLRGLLIGVPVVLFSIVEARAEHPFSRGGEPLFLIAGVVLAFLSFSFQKKK